MSFAFPVNCKVMVDAAIRLLSLVNQLAATTRRVCLDFEEGESGTMGYLNRMGFFDHLAPEVECFPQGHHIQPRRFIAVPTQRW